MEYDTEIDIASLSTESFVVDGSAVTKVYTNSTAEADVVSRGGTGGGGTDVGSNSSLGDGASPQSSASAGENPNNAWVSKAATVTTATVTQTGDISTSTGGVYAGGT